MKPGTVSADERKAPSPGSDGHGRYPPHHCERHDR
nr:MAG TPA: hypothetical protein [Caudoviricetes sp.]